MHAARSLVLIATTLLATACSADTASAPIQTPAPSAGIIGSFDLVAANGAPLPALAITRTLPNGQVEELVVERATLELAADGTWTQRLVLRVYADRMPIGTEALSDAGRWTAQGAVFTLRASDGARTVTLRSDVPDRLDASEPVRLGLPTLVNTRYQRHGAPASVVGQWTLSRAVGTPVPSVINRFHAPPENGDYVSDTKVDSATLTLTSDGRYQQKFWLSEWNDGVFNVRYSWSDHGTWTRAGDVLAFTSDYIQPIAFTGASSLDGTLATAQLPDLGAAGPISLGWVRRQ